MSIWSKLVGAFSGGLTKDIGEAIDRNVTSDEERLTLRNELAQIAQKGEEKLMEFQGVLEGEITERHKADMQSDSWLAKNVRPITLVVMTVVTVVFGGIGIGKEFDELGLVAFESTYAAIISLDMIVFGFYFSARGLEKVAKAFAGKK